MKCIAPRILPPLSRLLSDLGNPTPLEVSRMLHVSERTIKRWRATDDAPRAALLALFWQSSYGLSALDCELFNTAMVWRNLSDSLKKENENLHRRIARLEALGGFGCANSPLFHAPAHEKSRPAAAFLPLSGVS